MQCCPSLQGPKSFLLAPEDFWFLQFHIPSSFLTQEHWSITFHSRNDGKSWNRFASQLLQEGGVTVLVFRDADGYLFGSLTEDPWKCSPDFYGKKSNALFRLQPAMEWYRPTGYNSNFQVGMVDVQDVR